jgi:hypothetical protein
LSAKKELFSFENEGVSVHFLFEVTCELAFSRSGGVDVLSKKVGKEGPVSRLGGVGDPVSIHVHTFTTLFLIVNRLSNFSSVGGTFSDIVVLLSSSNLTPETHVSGGSLLGEGSQGLLNNETTVFSEADASPGEEVLVIRLEVRDETAGDNLSLNGLFSFSSVLGNLMNKDSVKRLVFNYKQ